MTTIPTGLAITSAVLAERTTPRGHRLALAGLLLQSAPGVPAGGRLRAPADINGDPLQVTGSPTDMEYTINAGVCAIPRTGQGVYLIALPSVTTIPTDPSDGTNPRIDRIYIAQPDPELSDGGVARVDVECGTPAPLADLVPPTLNPGEYELSRKVIAAGATNTSSGAPFTNVAPFTSANADVADGSIVTAKLGDGAVTNAKLAPTGLSASKFTIGTLPETVPVLGDTSGTIQGHPYKIQQADPGGPDGTIWDSW